MMGVVIIYLESYQKSLIRAILSITLLLSMSCNSLQNYNDENDFIIAIHDKTVEIIGYRGTKIDVNIPPRINDFPVTAIGSEAFDSFYNKSSIKLTSVKIPKGITFIGERSFRANNLNEIIIPNTVVSIGHDAFSFNNLTSIKIPDSVKHIGHRAFYRNKIKQITIPRADIEFGYGVFSFNEITKIVFPDGITKIEPSMFSNNELTSITIPESIVTIYHHAFQNNKFTELIIPENVISIDQDAFGYFQYSDGLYKNSKDIIKVTIGDNVKLNINAIRNFVFFYNSAVKKKGGTYIYTDHYWLPEDKSIPVYRFDHDNGWESSDIQFLLDMPDLEDVVLRDNKILKDITPLSELIKIKTLKIHDCPNIESIKALSSLMNLETLELTHNDSYDYNDLALLPNLQYLFIRGGQFSDIDLSTIGQLQNLKSLYLRANDNRIINNIDELHKLASLERLSIWEVRNLDLSWISNLYNLTRFSLTYCSVDDVSPLSSLPNLTHVDLRNSVIEEIKPLLNSNSIKYLKVREHDVRKGIDDNTRSQFYQKGVVLDTSYDNR